MSWEEINKKEEKKELSDMEKRFIQLCHQVLSTPQGIELLDLLSENCLKAPVCPHNGTTNYGYFREGENNMIRRLIWASKYTLGPIKQEAK